MKLHRFPVIPALILFIFILVLFLPAFLGLKGIFHDDQAMEEFPRYCFVANNLQKGIIPFWDPHTWCGAIPFYARYYANTYYSPLWPFFLLSGLDNLDQAYFFLIMMPLFVHYCLAALGMFVFLKRVIKLSEFSSLAGAIFYIFSPAFSYAYVWQQVVVLQCWLPWLLVLYHSLMQNSRLWKFITAGIVFNFIVTAASPNLIPFVLFIWLALIVPDLINRYKKKSSPVYKPALIAIIIILIGSCLSAVYILPSFEGAKYTREHLALSPQASLAEEKGSLHPVFLSTLFVPDLFGNIRGDNFDQLNPVHDVAFWDANLSGGIFVSFFVFLAFLIFFKKTSRSKSDPGQNLYVLFFILLYIFSLLCVLGRHSPFYINLVGRLPLVGQLPRPVRYRLIQCFSAAVLGGYALDYMYRKVKPSAAGLGKKVLIYTSVSFIVISLCLLYPFSPKKKNVFLWSEQPVDSTSAFYSGTKAIGRYSLDWPVTKLRIMFAEENKGEIRFADDNSVMPSQGKLIERYNIKNPGWHEFNLTIPPNKFFWLVSLKDLPIGYKRSGKAVKTFSYKDTTGDWAEDPYINSIWFIQQKTEDITPLYIRLFEKGPLARHIVFSLIYWLTGILLILGVSLIFSPRRAAFFLVFFAAAELVFFASLAFYDNRFNSYEGPNFVPHRRRYHLPSHNPILKNIVYDIPELREAKDHRFASDYPFYDNFSRINGGYSLMGYEMHPLELRFKKAIEKAYGMSMGWVYYFNNPQPLYNEFLSNFSVSYFIDKNPERLFENGSTVRAGKTKDEYLHFNPQALPRIYTNSIISAAGDARQLEHLLESDLRKGVYMSPDDFVSLEKTEKYQKKEYMDFERLNRVNKIYNIDTANPNSINVDIDIKVPAMLVFTDVWYPGWKAIVDGSKVQVYRVNYCQRGVYLSEGRHKICTEFYPESLKIGLYISMASLILILFAGILSFFKEFAPTKKGPK